MASIPNAGAMGEQERLRKKLAAAGGQYNLNAPSPFVPPPDIAAPTSKYNVGRVPSPSPTLRATNEMLRAIPSIADSGNWGYAPASRGPAGPINQGGGIGMPVNKSPWLQDPGAYNTGTGGVTNIQAVPGSFADRRAAELGQPLPTPSVQISPTVAVRAGVPQQAPTSPPMSRSVADMASMPNAGWNPSETSQSAMVVNPPHPPLAGGLESTRGTGMTPDAMLGGVSDKQARIMARQNEMRLRQQHAAAAWEFNKARLDGRLNDAAVLSDHMAGLRDEISRSQNAGMEPIAAPAPRVAQTPEQVAAGRASLQQQAEAMRAQQAASEPDAATRYTQAGMNALPPQFNREQLLGPDAALAQMRAANYAAGEPQVNPLTGDVASRYTLAERERLSRAQPSTPMTFAPYDQQKAQESINATDSAYNSDRIARNNASEEAMGVLRSRERLRMEEGLLGRQTRMAEGERDLATAQTEAAIARERQGSAKDIVKNQMEVERANAMAAADQARAKMGLSSQAPEFQSVKQHLETVLPDLKNLANSSNVVTWQSNLDKVGDVDARLAEVERLFPSLDPYQRQQLVSSLDAQLGTGFNLENRPMLEWATRTLTNTDDYNRFTTTLRSIQQRIGRLRAGAVTPRR